VDVDADLLVAGLLPVRQSCQHARLVILVELIGDSEHGVVCTGIGSHERDDAAGARFCSPVIRAACRDATHNHRRTMIMMR
jgi:hypothetical protein